MKVGLLVFLVALSISMETVRANPLVLRLGYTDHCPYTCVQGDRKGFLVEVVERILLDHGFAVQHVTASLPRIQFMAKRGDIDVVLPINQIDAQELGIARTIQSVATIEACYFVQNESRWHYGGMESFNGEVIGIVSGYKYPPGFASYLSSAESGRAHLTIAGEDAHARQIRMLGVGRITVLPADRLMFWHTARALGLHSLFREAGGMDLPKYISTFYVGVAIKNKDRLQTVLGTLEEGLGQMSKSRETQKIIKSYGI